GVVVLWVAQNGEVQTVAGTNFGALLLKLW
ncbi:MAG: hypothetical protein ACI97A_001060, partial [Planctomycetota bacterium]